MTLTSPPGSQASGLNILSQPVLPANHPLLVDTGISELGEQVAVHGSSWKSDSMVSSPGTREEGQQSTKLQGVCHLIKSARASSAVEMQHARLTPGPKAQMLVTEPQSERQGPSAAPHPATAFHMWGY